MGASTTRPDREALARNVKRLRDARGWNQTELGEAAGGLRQAAISQIENRLGNPTLDTLEHLASALGCRVRDLFKPSRVRKGPRRPKSPTGAPRPRP
jgi:transcriptional regulator with XRE-family HTH domain